MKNVLTKVVLALLLIVSFSCKKTIESMINCTGESLFMSVHRTVDASSSKLVHFEARYTGEHNFDSVTWEFGDGKTATGKKVDHTYAASGTYQVKAKIKVTNGDSSCESDPVRSITVN